jgi:hypothetical protein
MSKIEIQKLLSVSACGILLLNLTACGGGPRMLVNTGTTLGLKATPGDGQTQPPQVTLGYKRAESALIPTKGKTAQGCAPKKDKNTSTCETETDAFSSLGAIHLDTRWFGTTEIRSFVGTGIAARDIIDKKDFKDEFENAALDPNALAQMRRDAVDDIAAFVVVGDSTSKAKLQAFFLCVGKSPDIATKLATTYAGNSREEFIENFKRSYGPVAPQYRDKCIEPLGEPK